MAFSSLHRASTFSWSDSPRSAPSFGESGPFGTTLALGKLELGAGAVPNGPKLHLSRLNCQYGPCVSASSGGPIPGYGPR